MDQYDEVAVRRELEPYHTRILRVIQHGYAEWDAVKRLMAENSLGPFLYPRTVSNVIFDCVMRRALAEFNDNSDIRVIQEPQTIKFFFRDVVLARFRKGDEDNLGRNVPTQAVMDFVHTQGTLPGIPPSAAKVEILYSETDIADAIDRVMVVARNGDALIWSYELDDRGEAGDIIPFPSPLGPQDEGDETNVGLVVPRNRDEDSKTSEG